MYDFVMPFMIQMVSEMNSRDNEIKKEQTKEKEKVTTTTLDFVSHDLEMMMPGSQLMLTGGGGSQYQSVGGMPPGPPGMVPPGPPGMVPPQPPMGAPPGMMGGYPGAPGAPYPPR